MYSYKYMESELEPTRPSTSKYSVHVPECISICFPRRFKFERRANRALMASLAAFPNESSPVNRLSNSISIERVPPPATVVTQLSFQRVEFHTGHGTRVWTVEMKDGHARGSTVSLENKMSEIA